MISLSARGLTTGEVQAHLAEVYGAEVSRQTISTITDKVVEGMAEWANRPLDPVYPVIFIDAINVKIRDGKVANRPIYVALAVTCDGHRDILGLWAGDALGGRGGCEVLAARAHRDQEPRRERRAHGRLRRPDRPAGRGHRHLGADDHADVCGAPAAQQLPLRRRQHFDAIAKALRPIYTAATEAAAMERFLEFCEVWGERYPAIVRLWENAWAEFVPFLSFDAEIRKIVCTTNAMVILSPQDDQACELLLCVVNSVADVAVHDVRIGEETRGLGVSRCGRPGGRDPLLAEGLGERIAETLVVGLQFTDALCGDLDAA